MVTVAVSPTRFSRFQSLKSLISKVSVLSVVRSLARVWANVIVPSDWTTREPLRSPVEKSSASMPVPLVQ